MPAKAMRYPCPFHSQPTPIRRNRPHLALVIE